MVDRRTIADLAAMDREQFKLISTGVSHNLSRVIVCDVFLLWLLLSHAHNWLGWVWFALITAAQFYRRWQVRHMIAMGIDATTAMRKLDWLFLLVGVLRASFIPLVFVDASAQTAQHLTTIVMLGLAAGGVTSVAGRMRSYLFWSAPVYAALVIAWLSIATVDAVVLALLIAWMASTLLQFVREAYRTLSESIAIRAENVELVATLRVARDTALSAVEARTRFFAAASHDLRQPLHAMSMHVATLGLKADGAVAETVAQLERSIGHANTLLEGLIDMSQLDSGTVAPKSRHFRASDLGEALDGEFSEDASRLGLAFNVSMPEVWLTGDPDLLLRMLRNLVGNAIRFTPSGSVSVELIGDAGNSVDIVVRDTGVGIPDSENTRVFEEFYQLGNPGRDRSRGLGLGLSIVKRLGDLLDVPVRMDSNVGVGTAFTLSVPRYRGEQPQPAPRSNRTRGPLSQAVEVLVVDDEQPIVDGTIAAFTEINWGCRGATDASAALALLDNGWRPNVLLVDMRLGATSGLDLLNELESRIGSCVAIVITGESSPAQMSALRASGRAFIHKPVSMPVLVEMILAQLQSRGETDEKESGVVIETR